MANPDMADFAWSPPRVLNIRGGVLYADRPLTRWEWVRVRVFRRRDPRLLARF
jgi:hypothetical protein